MDFSFLSIDCNTLNSGALKNEIKQVEDALKITIPKALSDFLCFSNGAILAERVIFFSCQGSEESLVNYNNEETVAQFFRVGRFSSDEFGYKKSDILQDDPPLYVLDHETNEYVLEADNLIDFLKKYNKCHVKRRKWYSFLFQ